MELSVSSSATCREITGSTTLCAILADPIHHVRTPQAFNALMDQWNKDTVLVPMLVGQEHLEAVINGLRQTGNLAGFLVTVPHKSAVLELCDDATTRAYAVGAVNVVRREADGRLVGEPVGGALDGLCDVHATMTGI